MSPEINGLLFISFDTNVRNLSIDKPTITQSTLVCINGYVLLYEMNQMPSLIFGGKWNWVEKRNPKWKMKNIAGMKRVNERVIAFSFGIHGNQWTLNILPTCYHEVTTIPLTCLKRCQKSRMNKQAQNWMKLDSPDRNYYLLLKPFSMKHWTTQCSIWNRFARNLNSSVKTKCKNPNEKR